MLTPWRKKSREENTEQLDPVPRYADFLEVMEYESCDPIISDRLLEERIKERGGDGVRVHTPVVYAFRNIGTIPGRTKPYITILETEPERVAFLAQFGRLAHIEDPDARPRVITPGPLMYWDTIPTLYDDDLPYVARYVAVGGDGTWPDIWIKAITPDEIDLEDPPYRDRYLHSFKDDF